MTAKLKNAQDMTTATRAGMAFHMPGETFDTASVAAHMSLLLGEIGFENWPTPCDDPMSAVYGFS